MNGPVGLGGGKEETLLIVMLPFFTLAALPIVS